MLRISPKKSRLTIWLLAAVLLLVGATAAAHELDHALDHHQELCALHHYAGHHGSVACAAEWLPMAPSETQFLLLSSHRCFSKPRPAPYAVRAPPHV